MGPFQAVLGYGYIFLVGWIYARRGFSWAWFLSLSFGAIFLTLLLVPSARTPVPNSQGVDAWLYPALAMFFAYPFPGFLSVKLDPKIPQNLPRDWRMILRIVLYFGVYTFAMLFFALILALIHAESPTQ